MIGARIAYICLISFFSIQVYSFYDGCILITTLYNEIKQNRLEEYKSCIQKNIENSYIKEIHVFYDHSKDGEDNKLLDFLSSQNVQIHSINGRLSFGDAIDFANSLQKDIPIIIANGDIYFNETIQSINRINLETTNCCLTRWNKTKSGLYKETFKGNPNYMSADAWVFKTPFCIVNCYDLFLGTWQCDSLFALNCFAQGISLVNPCLDIQACHLHESQERNYTEKYILTQWNCPEVPWCKSTDYSGKQACKISIFAPLSGDIDIALNKLNALTKDASFSVCELFITCNTHSEEDKIKISQFADTNSKITYIHCDSRSTGAVLNEMFERSRGEYIAFYDENNSYAKYTFDLMARELEKYSHMSFVYGKTVLSEKTLTNYYHAILENGLELRTDTGGLWSDTVAVPVLWKKDFHSAVGVFDENLNEKILENFIKRCLEKKNEILFFDKVLCSRYSTAPKITLSLGNSKYKKGKRRKVRMRVKKRSK